MIFSPYTYSKNSKKTYYVFNGSFIILPQYVGEVFKCYNGKIFINLEISSNMVGFRFGEFFKK